MEECSLLADARKTIGKEEMRMWKTRHIQKTPERKKKGPVEPEKEPEPDKLERFFCHLYEFHNPVPSAPFVPANFPPRYAIEFVPALPVIPVPVPDLAPSASVPSSDFSIVSSANFVVSSPPVIVSSPTCIVLYCIVFAARAEP